MNDSIRQWAIHLDSEIERISSLPPSYARSVAIDDALDDLNDFLTAAEAREQICSRRIRGLYDNLSAATAPQSINEFWKEIGQEENGHRELVKLINHKKGQRLALIQSQLEDLTPAELVWLKKNRLGFVGAQS